jgi:hypothetical protein
MDKNIYLVLANSSSKLYSVLNIENNITMSWEADTVRRLLATMDERQIRQQINDFRKRHFSSFLIMALHLLLGFVLAFTGYQAAIEYLPYLFLVSSILVVYNHPKNSQLQLWLFVLLSLACGFGIEYYNAHYAPVLGHYAYSDKLGPEWRGIPIYIGLFWSLTVYCCGMAVNRFAPRTGAWLKALLGAFMLLSLDILVQPVAMIYGLWNWDNNVVPHSHYAAIFAICLLLLFVFQYMFRNEYNKTAVFLYFVLFLFYWMLGIDF